MKLCLCNMEGLEKRTRLKHVIVIHRVDLLLKGAYAYGTRNEMIYTFEQMIIMLFIS